MSASGDTTFDSVGQWRATTTTTTHTHTHTHTHTGCGCERQQAARSHVGAAQRPMSRAGRRSSLPAPGAVCPFSQAPTRPVDGPGPGLERAVRGAAGRSAGVPRLRFPRWTF